MSEMDTMFKNVCSTDKSKKKQAVPVRLKHLSCSKPIETANKTKERERTQPVKIAQLFDNYKQSKSDKKDNVPTARKILPKRLTYAFTASKNVELSEKGNGTMFSHRNVRRNLISTFEVSKKDPPSNLNSVASVKKKASHKQESNRLTAINLVQKENSSQINRRSFLAPPNSIRDMYLQQKHLKGKELLSNVHVQTPYSVSNQSEINDYNNITGINVTAYDEAVGKQVVTLSKSEINSGKIILTHNLCEGDYNQSITDNDTKVCEKICVDKKDIDLIKSFMHSMQEEISVLRDMLICIKETLSKEKSKKNIEDDNNCIESVVEELNKEPKIIINMPEISKTVTEEVEAEMYSKNNHFESPESTENDKVQTSLLKKSDTSVEQINKKELDFLHENDKENYNVNSLSQDSKISNSDFKLKMQAGKLIPKHMRAKSNSDDSFLKLEKELCIMHLETPTNLSCTYSTPLRKVNGKRVAPFLKEYMALKSSISFLETPDVKRFQCFYHSDDNVEPVNSKTYLSNKILTDLHNLYTESPEILEN